MNALLVLSSLPRSYLKCGPLLIEENNLSLAIVYTLMSCTGTAVVATSGNEAAESILRLRLKGKHHYVHYLVLVYGT